MLYLFVESAEAGCALNARNKILVSLVSQFGGQLKDCKSLKKILDEIDHS